MNKKSIEILEYQKILDRLTEFATSKLGKELCMKLYPINNIEDILRMQDETTKACDKIRIKGNLNFSGLKDIKSSLKILEIGSNLNINEFYNINNLLKLSTHAKSYNMNNKADEEINSIDEYFLGIEEIKDLSKELDRCILSSDMIADDASKELSAIRKKLKNINANIHNYLNQTMNSYRDYLMESMVTIRDNAYCLPVKAEFKNRVAGIIHGQSATGSTFFIEPMPIIKLNNEIKELEIKQAQEEEKILKDLSIKTMPYIDSLRKNQDILTKLDFIFAKAKFSKSLNANEPIFNDKYYINIKEARHPLLDRNVVPIDISLGKDFNSLVITGPNTGGKTVSLKTVGLLTLMGQSGLHIPAIYGSTLAIFDDVFADIGDEQSIEQSLSFFSGHMKNIVNIIKNANSKCLCLFDELGAGTDPTEGAALAISILSFLNKNNIRTISTTHYSELKIFALNTPMVENASCEFDLESLQPTFKILIGVAGKSNAFAISKKLGLPDYIIEDAKQHIGVNEQSFEDLLIKLEENKITIEKERKEIEKQRKEIEGLKNRYKDKDEKLDKRSKDIINNAKNEANDILRRAKQIADESIKNINKIAEGAGIGRALEQQREKIRGEINQNNINIASDNNKLSKGKEADINELKIGSLVHINSLNLDGNITNIQRDKEIVFVQAGILNTKVNLKDISILTQAKDEKIKNIHKSKSSKLMKAANISPQINVIALNVDEACAILDKYLDDALLANLNTVKIIHGRGTYALQKGIHAYLKKLSFVKSYNLADFEDGGSAITIVHFK